jgi:S-DNA-T family DNA segregation ATPase FtsK/SpoIIIE
MHLSHRFLEAKDMLRNERAGISAVVSPDHPRSGGSKRAASNMSRSNPATLDSGSNRFVLTTFVWRQIASLAGFALIGALALAVAALSTWNVADPSFSYATSDEPTNLLGYGGAAFADIFMQFFGLASVVALLPAVAWAFVLIGNKPFDKVVKRLGLWFAGSVLASAALSCVPAPITWPLPNGLGGVFGDMILRFPALFTGTFPTGTFATILACLFAAPAAWCLIYSAGLIGVSEEEEEESAPEAAPSKARTVGDELEEEDGEGPFTLLMGSLTHMRFTAQARLRRMFGMSATRAAKRHYDEPYDFNNDEFGTLNEPVRPKAQAGADRVEPSLDRAERRIVTPPSIMADEDDDPPFDLDDVRPAGILPDDEDDIAADWAPRPAPPKPGLSNAGSRVAPPPARPRSGQSLRTSPAMPRSLPMRSNRTPACSRACSRTSASRARSSMSAPVRSSRSTSWSRHRASSHPASSALPTTSPAR